MQQIIRLIWRSRVGAGPAARDWPSAQAGKSPGLRPWGVSVVPRLLVQGLLDQGLLVNVAPSHTLLIQLYWHCWNLASEVLDALTAALKQSSAQSLVPLDRSEELKTPEGARHKLFVQRKQ